ncbi:MAG: hypothetical protein M3P46_00650 [Actinomycetota bacterium]|nr:hypothetical protein [Actinomycetota bacterium]
MTASGEPEPGGAQPADVRITFARSGGFAGLCLECALDTAELDDPDRRSLLDSLAGLDLPALAQQSGGAGGPDRFSYDLTVETGGQRYDLRYPERTLPDGLRPLVQQLVERSRRGR